jgi:hypothetical protein
MKNTASVLLLCVFSIACLAQSKDEMAIKKVINDETDAFIKLNYAKEITYYVHEPYAVQQYNHEDGSVVFNEGWDSINKGLKAYFKASPKPSFLKVERSNWKLKMMSPDWYWVRFDQIMTDINGKPGKSKEDRLMQRIGGQWKIASMVAMWDFKK